MSLGKIEEIQFGDSRGCILSSIDLTIGLNFDYNPGLKFRLLTQVTDPGPSVTLFFFSFF